jgi:hypothetical protein
MQNAENKDWRIVFGVVGIAILVMVNLLWLRIYHPSEEAKPVAPIVEAPRPIVNAVSESGSLRESSTPQMTGSSPYARQNDDAYDPYGPDAPSQSASAVRRSWQIPTGQNMRGGSSSGSGAGFYDAAPPPRFTTWRNASTAVVLPTSPPVPGGFGIPSHQNANPGGTTLYSPPQYQRPYGGNGLGSSLR